MVCAISYIRKPSFEITKSLDFDLKIGVKSDMETNQKTKPNF